MTFFFCFVEAIAILTPGVLNGKFVLFVLAMQTVLQKKLESTYYDSKYILPFQKYTANTYNIENSFLSLTVLDLTSEQLVKPGMDKACIPSIFIKTSQFFFGESCLMSAFFGKLRMIEIGPRGR